MPTLVPICLLQDYEDRAGSAAQVAADVALLLHKFAWAEPFAAASGGGGRASNMRLVLALLCLGVQRARSCSEAALQVRQLAPSVLQRVWAAAARIEPDPLGAPVIACQEL